jgi:8-oxo-dGTP pyrophosphatase MutT (NUDIX family)
MPTVPRDAASIILLRDGSCGDDIEILMVRRHERSDFAGGMYVFPGGAVEEPDCGEGAAALCAGMVPENAMSIIGEAPSPARALGIFIAGIRETFEETGILLAYEAQGELVSYAGEGGARFSTLRTAIENGKLTFNEMIEEEGLKLAVDRLAYFAHWITPEFSPIRYDTHFFLAPAPPAQDALHDNVEMTAHLWITPHEALERSEGGTFAMLPPTIINLMALKRFSTVKDALATVAEEEVPAIRPQVSFEDGNIRLIFPGDPDQT